MIEGPERIWLQNAKDADPAIGRLWCEDKVWPDNDEDGEPTEYVLASSVRNLSSSVKALLESISFDDNGALIGGKWMGGHGGLLSEETRKKADDVMRELQALETGRQKKMGGMLDND